MCFVHIHQFKYCSQKHTANRLFAIHFLESWKCFVTLLCAICNTCLCMYCTGGFAFVRIGVLWIRVYQKYVSIYFFLFSAHSLWSKVVYSIRSSKQKSFLHHFPYTAKPNLHNTVKKLRDMETSLLLYTHNIEF